MAMLGMSAALAMYPRSTLAPGGTLRSEQSLPPKPDAHTQVVIVVFLKHWPSFKHGGSHCESKPDPMTAMLDMLSPIVESTIDE
jgi:hypothetical protein